MKALLKKIITYILNPISMYKMASIGRHIYICKGLHVDNGGGFFYKTL